MVRVEFLGPIQEATLELEVSSLHALKEILAQKESLKPWLAMSAVALNGVLIDDLHTPLKAGDHIMLLPPVCGG
ncbi:MoaD/ThiS family protein [Helicobacter cynogastricus]|uniref:MoaD/ThiS family protein n=1 Tax=Helicobacter cynogastricus TaxID=329937 RepID=UPI000CF05339|nr:MoaD/ThiS family protein [Helicobacter cynogastricus]